MEIRENIYYWKSDRPYAEGNVQINDESDEIVLKMQVFEYLKSYFNTSDFKLMPGSGEGNHKTYLADFEGVRYFIRLENGPEKDDYMDVESRIIKEINKIGIPSTIVFHSDGSRESVPFAIQILEFINFKDLNNLYKKGEIDLIKIAGNIGQLIAKYQSLTFQKFGLFSPRILKSRNELVGYHNHYHEYFFLNWNDHLNYLLDNDFLKEQDLYDIKAVVEKYKHVLDIEKGCLVHKDVALWNILGTKSEIKAFIDWDDAISGDPVDDISLLACFHQGDVILSAIEGYKTIRKLPENFEQRFWLHLLRNIIFKSVIRVRGGYFNLNQDFFMLSNDKNSSSFKSFTYKRIKSAVMGLNGLKQISELE